MSSKEQSLALANIRSPSLPLQSFEGLRDGLSLDLDPGPGQVERVGDDASGASGRHGGHALDGRVAPSAALAAVACCSCCWDHCVKALLEKVVKGPPGGAAGHVGGQRGSVPSVEPADPVLSVDGAGDVPKNTFMFDKNCSMAQLKR